MEEVLLNPELKEYQYHFPSFDLTLDEKLLLLCLMERRNETVVTVSGQEFQPFVVCYAVVGKTESFLIQDTIALEIANSLCMKLKLLLVSNNIFKFYQNENIKVSGHSNSSISIS